ncbi:hypothetical protein [Chitiniphilus eburneus]|uniref:hypothetical protein n=1 Tax=Chitiniphilus eburneus TaxID=2571148 RepID=UPI0035CFEAAD
MSERVESLLVDLIAAVMANTQAALVQAEAISQLALSNQNLIDLMVEQGELGDESGGMYLDGERVL